MPTPIKLGVIGAGSATFSVGLIKDICLQQSLSGSLVTLMDINQERLEPMLEFGRRYAAELGADVKFEMTLDRAAALQDADFIVNTAQAGGHHFVEGIRAWTESQGYYRGFRLPSILNIRLMLAVARDMARLCPDAWLIQAGNPVFEGCTAMTRETGVKVCGLCHGHGGEYAIAHAMGLDESKVKGESVGFNHEIWLIHFEYEGQNAYPLFDEWIETKSEQYWRDYRPHYGQNQVSRAAIELYKLAGYIPIGDTPRRGGWWLHTDLAAKKKWYGGPLGGFDSELGWAEYLKGLEEEVARIHAAVADTSRKLTDLFPPRPTGEQHFPLIDALVNDNQVELQVNVRNRGVIEGIPDDVVVEVRAKCDARGIHPYHVGKLPDHLMTAFLLPRLLEAERMIALATRPDPRMLMAWILEDHRTRSWEDAVAFYNAILARPEFEELAAEMKRSGRELKLTP
jgi:alpha-galactosidase